MSLMDVFVKIGADTSGLESGISKAKGLASGLGSAVGTGFKVVGAAIGAATTAAVGFAASAVEVGKTFDASMAQVAATMGVSVSEIGELRDFAQEMGRTTAFSATEAADALNYMALAGYTAEESMSMLPNVLNLAAAGDMELARASDMVTDAQSALGLEMEDMEGFVDQLAKTASKSNTSVAQLGDAILTVGGTAKNLAGGTTELNTVLGILADNGIKGAEGGTHLRNVILSLSAPTDKAASLLEELGVTTKDAEGNLRPMQDVMGELSQSLAEFGSAEKAEIISSIFNKTDIAAVNALLDKNSIEWSELSAAIDDSAGAADKMAKTQLDNLAGDITLFKSALEGAQIAVSDQLTPSLRDFVKFGTDGLSQITGAFMEGGLSGAMEAFGEVLSNGIAMVTEKIPDAINAGMELLGAVGKGIIDNLPVIVDAATQILVMLVNGLVEALPMLAEGAVTLIESFGSSLSDNSEALFKAGADILTNVIQGITDAIPTIVDGVVNVISSIGDFLIENAAMLIQSAGELILAIATGIGEALPELIPTVVEVIITIVENLINNIDLLIDAAIAIITGLAEGLINALPKLIEKAPEIIQKLVDALVRNLPKVAEAALKIVVELAGAIIKNLPEMEKAAIKTLTAYITGILKLGAKLTETGKKVITTIKDAIMSFDFKSWGKDMIDNFVSGIIGAIGKVKDAAKNVAGAVRSFLHFSEPDIGPLADFSSYAPDMMKLFAKGITDNKQMLMDTVSGAFDFRDLIEAPTLKYASDIDGYTSANSVLKSMEKETSDSRDLTVILELDRSQFAKAIYRLNNEEVQRVGVNLAGGYA